ncbi:hypothetical protein NEMBOFW57_006610 [Staphylotrichum longicolle]|uniref:Fungal N-terminal domain-containing protein n=1 Tax=Staphylotrichum longicolle TaxID=669026 RepID=A0AAD4ETW8_9PEZI|nr:hypothetical protein NEMBOFW57_006610 [Staphylotrichum longicolle]
MELALTFGSLGDIIAICQLCVQLSRALGSGCQAVAGSAKEYQDLLYLTELDRATKTVVEECAALIEGALQHFGTRYHGSLQTEGSGSKCRDAYKKIEWALREKERLLELREKLQRNTERLTLLNGLAARKSARVDNATMLARIDEVQRLVSAEASCREEMLRLLKGQHDIANRQADQLKAVNDQLVACSRSNSDVLASVKQSLAAVVEIKELLAQIAKREYTLEDEVTGKDLDQTLPPALSLRRGMKLNMSMIFAVDVQRSRTCPRCHTDNMVPDNRTIPWEQMAARGLEHMIEPVFREFRWIHLTFFVFDFFLYRSRETEHGGFR